MKSNMNVPKIVSQLLMFCAGCEKQVVWPEKVGGGKKKKEKETKKNLGANPKTGRGFMLLYHECHFLSTVPPLPHSIWCSFPPKLTAVCDCLGVCVHLQLI